MVLRVRSLRDIAIVLNGLVVAGVAAAIYSLGLRDLITVSSVLATVNYAALIVLVGTIIVPMCCYTIYTRLPLMLLGIAAIYVTDSRATLVAATMIIAYRYVIYPARYHLFGWRTFLILGILLSGAYLNQETILQFAGDSKSDSVLSLLDYESNFSNLERLRLLEQSIDSLRENSLGRGVGSSTGVFLTSTYTEGSYPHPHSTPAMLMVELGYFGVLLFAVLVCFILHWIRLSSANLEDDAMQTRAAVVHIGIALLLFSLYDAALYNGGLAIFFFLCLSLVSRGHSILASHSSSKFRSPVVAETS